ncbi:hypothetical protein MSAN_01751300 [Mycena sanguinolenta]|uniref:Uncharacterized protein n=1 Tax=Mycena sanguinolenta TaxID=230812 RepID=A0A8H6XX81_9AGAR|nr:hypothetical protein MSAN_01751300 [Mycena sanguinolenta]
MSTTPTPTLSAHAARNPSKPIQAPRQRARKSDAGSATQGLDGTSQSKKAQMQDDVDDFYDYRAQKITELAVKYEKDEPYFLRLLSNKSQYSASRGATLYNAIRHDLAVKARENGESKNAMDLNEDLGDGEYERLRDSLPKEEKQRLLAQLTAHRELKKKGIRATNKSAAADAMQNANRIGDVMDNLYARTGVRGFAMCTRGNPDDPAKPHFVDSDDSRDFITQYLKMDPKDLVRKFELWACTRDSGVKERHDDDTMRKEIGQMILEGLWKIKNDKTLSMEYANYRYVMLYQLGIELVGWPSWVEMARASKLSAEAVRCIHHGLKTGAIYWGVLSKSRRDEIEKEIDERRAEGPVKSRKGRSDKGKVRGPRKQAAAEDDSEEEEERLGVPDPAASVQTANHLTAAAHTLLATAANAAAPIAATAAPTTATTIPATHASFATAASPAAPTTSTDPTPTHAPVPNTVAPTLASSNDVFSFAGDPNDLLGFDQRFGPCCLTTRHST